MRSWTVLALALTTACTATEPRPAPILAPGATVFRDVRLFDGERLVPRATVVVQGGKIVLAGADVEVPAGPEMRVIDGAGKTLLPGFIDAHTPPPSRRPWPTRRSAWKTAS